jgi:hypothetical protein
MNKRSNKGPLAATTFERTTKPQSHVVLKTFPFNYADFHEYISKQQLINTINQPHYSHYQRQSLLSVRCKSVPRNLGSYAQRYYFPTPSDSSGPP